MTEFIKRVDIVERFYQITPGLSKHEAAEILGKVEWPESHEYDNHELMKQTCIFVKSTVTEID